MSLAFYLARRLPLRSDKRGGKTGVTVAVTGIALAVMVMIISVSVMIGFREAVRSKIMGFDSQITVAPRGMDGDISLPTISYDDLGEGAELMPGGATAVLTARQPAILKTAGNFSGVIVKGVDTGYDWDFIRRSLVDGDVPDYGEDSTLYHIVISRIIAEDLGLGTGDRVDTYFIGDGTYRTRRLKIAGIYDTHFTEYDRNIVFSCLPMLRQVSDTQEGRGALIEINGLKSDEEIDRLSSRISESLMDGFYSGRVDRTFTVVNIHESAALYFNWLALLDTNVAVILTLMAILASLTLVSSLFILVLRRVNTIGVLKALGASNRLVRRTFILMTLRILMFGLAAGDLLGLGLVAIQKFTAIAPLDPEAYYLDHVPVVLPWLSVAILNIVAAVVAFAVLLVPSAIISTIKPARVINYE